MTRVGSSTEPTIVNSSSAASGSKSFSFAVVWVLLGRLSGAALNFLVVSIVLPRILTQGGDFGRFVAAQSFVAFVAIWCMAGQNEGVVRFVPAALALRGNTAARRAFFDCLFWVLIGVAIAAPIGMWAVGRFGAGVGAELHPVVLFVAIVGVSLQIFLGESLRGFHRVEQASLVSGGQTGGPLSHIAMLAVCGVLAWQGSAALAAVFAAFALAVWAPVPVAGWMLRSALASHQERPSAVAGANKADSTRGEIGRVGLTLMIGQLLACWMAQGDQIVADAVWDHQAMGSDLDAYAAARRLVLFAGMPAQVLFMSVVAKVSEHVARGDTPGLERRLRRASLLAAIPAFVFLAILALFPGEILQFLSGKPEYARGAGALRWLCLGFSALAFCGNPVPFLGVTGRAGVAVAINLLAAAVLAFAGPWAARTGGAEGLAMAAAGAFFLQNVLGWIAVRVLLGVWSHPGWPRETP